jgi:hypothetical protein
LEVMAYNAEASFRQSDQLFDAEKLAHVSPLGAGPD